MNTRHFQLKTNNNESKALSQVFKHKTLYDPNPLRSLKVNPIKYMIESKRYSGLELACADVLLDRMNEKGFVAYTQDDIALEADCGIDTVASTERKLTDDGLLILQRNYRMPTLARMSSYFKDRSVKRRLKIFLPSLVSTFIPYEIPQSVIIENNDFLLARTLPININNSDVLYLNDLFINSLLINRMREKNNIRLVESLKMTTFSEKNSRWKTPAIKRLTKMLHLTIHGAIELTQFPDEVLIDAEKVMSNQKRADKRLADPFLYFLGICYKICKERSVIRATMYTKSLKLEFAIPKDMEFIEFDFEELDPFDEEDEKKFKKSQKRENRNGSSLLNAQLSYRDVSGERPSTATPLDIKAITISQFESGEGLIKNNFTRSLYAMFKEKVCS